MFLSKSHGLEEFHKYFNFDKISYMCGSQLHQTRSNKVLKKYGRNLNLEQGWLWGSKSLPPNQPICIQIYFHTENDRVYIQLRKGHHEPQDKIMLKSEDEKLCLDNMRY